MLQTFLFVAIPAFAAAIYLLYRKSREDQQAYGQPQFRAQGNWSTAHRSGGDTAANRSGDVVTNRSGNTVTNGSGDGVTNRRARRSVTPRSHTGECVVCFEESSIVELYPCQHRSLCENCVFKIISGNRGVCPLCRTRIHGYRDEF